MWIWWEKRVGVHYGGDQISVWKFGINVSWVLQHCAKIRPRKVIFWLHLCMLLWIRTSENLCGVTLEIWLVVSTIIGQLLGTSML